ncbi:hypothetical protein SAMN05192558_109158 [Actinokineospora alba]|uniref:Uncharacterized protein n=1 Tax=Actinokineospora alba TaxID=504798 RepID=A0A1H0SYN4_9PSEU|nr:hypothetical protein C8E96_1984 [Actinokineospora alba]SDJ52602.1 hypothetical protein SAMN05421871_11846 [Actinokineospora alba]SDP46680.1 hypothetical protein SAMN05192558_109158 [Actinokineospora alba]
MECRECCPEELMRSRNGPRPQETLKSAAIKINLSFIQFIRVNIIGAHEHFAVRLYRYRQFNQSPTGLQNYGAISARHNRDLNVECRQRWHQLAHSFHYFFRGFFASRP